MTKIIVLSHWESFEHTSMQWHLNDVFRIKCQVFLPIFAILKYYIKYYKSIPSKKAYMLINKQKLTIFLSLHMHRHRLHVLVTTKSFVALNNDCCCIINTGWPAKTHVIEQRVPVNNMKRQPHCQCFIVA